MFKVNQSVKLRDQNPEPFTVGVVIRETMSGRILVNFDDGRQDYYKPGDLERWPKLGEERYVHLV